MNNDLVSILIRNKGLIAIIAISIAILFTYWPLQKAAFVNFDDPEYIINNTHVTTGISLENIVWAFTHRYSANWHPLTWISHMIDCQIFGLHAPGHHLINIGFHLINSLLVFVLAYKIIQSYLPAFFMALLFAVHPLHVESVSWISERKDLLCAFFMLLSLITYLNYGQKYQKKLLYFSFFWGICALLSKPMAVTLPLLMCLLDYYPLNRHTVNQNFFTTLHKLVFEKIPLLICVGASCIVTIWAQHGSNAIVSTNAIPMIVRFANAILSCWAYLISFVYPINLSIFYPYMRPLIVGKILEALAGLLIFSVLAFVFKRKAPWIVAGWIWFLLMLVPVIGIMQVGIQSRADRYMYLPMFGLLLIVVYGLWLIFKNSSAGKAIYIILFSIIAIIFGNISHTQVLYWKDSVTLFEHATNIDANNKKAHTIVGTELLFKGDTTAALFHFQNALRVNPFDRIVLLNYGSALDGKKQYAEARECFHKILAANALDIDALLNIGTTFLHEQKYDSAQFYFSQCLAINPQHTGSLYNKAIIFDNVNNIDSAIFYYSLTLTADSMYLQAPMNAGLMHLRLAEPAKAVLAFKQVLKINPRNIKALYLQVIAYAQAGNVTEALSSGKDVLKKYPKFEQMQQLVDSLSRLK